jgi:hypothetical protein
MQQAVAVAKFAVPAAVGAYVLYRLAAQRRLFGLS